MQGFHVKLAALDLFIQTLNQAITAYETTGHSEHTSAAEFTEACANFVSKYSQLFHQFNRANTAIRNQLEIMATNFSETRSEYADFEASNVTRFEGLAANFSAGPEGTDR